MAMNTNDADYDRASEVKLFEESKKGVKGLVDSGLTTIPRFFIHPSKTLSSLKPDSHARTESISIPVIDLSDSHSAIVDQIRGAAQEFGFFQVINHGIALETIDRIMAATKAFHEQPSEMKAPLYGRGPASNIRYFSNVDLHYSKAACWFDTFYVKVEPNSTVFNELPDICRKEYKDWNKEVEMLVDKLMGLMSEGLGLGTERLNEHMHLNERTIVGHCYPSCPQPDLTMGNATHTDPGAMAVVIQDQIGGLQVEYGGLWVDVKPVPGAIVINVGDLLQVSSNS